MIILIPLGGQGVRFKENGYTEPKALIKIFGKPMIFYLLDFISRSINGNESQLDAVYIPYMFEYGNYEFENLLRHHYPQLKLLFFPLNKLTQGATETILLALEYLKKINFPDRPILCLDSDTFYTTNILSMFTNQNEVFTFYENQQLNIYSFVEMDSTDRIVSIKEKERISNYACSGAYGFSSYHLLLQFCHQILTNDIRQKNEYYTSCVIGEMLQNNYYFINRIIKKDDIVCIGTPFQLQLFCNSLDINNSPLISIPKLRFCFDLDNTLVSFPTVPNNYTTVLPINKNIRYLQYLKSLGHTIIIYTARKMRTNGGNVGLTVANIGQITFDTLAKYNIPYDELHFGKPYAHYYIDDLAINSHDSLDKRIGYYNTSIDPRYFNQIENNQAQFQTIKKITSNPSKLIGEIYYYNNLPNQIRKYFPLFINYDYNNNLWYVMEKINGSNLTSIYLSELLNEKLLHSVMNVIRSIQCSVTNEQIQIDLLTTPNLNIYANYCTKLNERTQMFDYNIFGNYEIVYQELFDALSEYESNQMGKICVIHGDCVMSNILIDTNEQIKLIDMRGKLNEISTIYGDWLYDWAKIYQSLIGYDEILQDQSINPNYKKKIIQSFQNTFIQFYSEQDFRNLQIVTKSLLYTLIPLHSNHIDKCIKYYELIHSNWLQSF